MLRSGSDQCILPLLSMVMPPGPAFFFSSLALRISIALWVQSSAMARSCCHRGGVAVVHVRLVAVDQVQVLHGVVEVGAIADGLVEVLQALIDERRVLLRQRLHHLLGRLRRCPCHRRSGRRTAMRPACSGAPWSSRSRRRYRRPRHRWDRRQEPSSARSSALSRSLMLK